MTADRVDRGINLVLVAVAIMTAASLVLLALAVPAVFSSRNNTSEVREGNELTGCRGAINAQVTAHLVEVILIQSEGLEAVVTENDAARDSAIVRLNRERNETREALAVYQEAVARSRKDPGAFLAECRNGD